MTEFGNAALQEALQVMDKIPPPPRQFAQFLRRCAISLKSPESVPFSEDEVQMMLDQFSITPTEFDAMFSASLYLLQQAACFSFDSTKTQAYAAQVGASETIAECFGAVWDAEGDDLIEALKQRTIADKTLVSTAWRLNLKAADPKAGPIREPVLLLDLSVSGEKPVTVQFGHAELSKFYDQIEKIQQEVDRLT
jgi:hypothetical protein